MAVVKVKSQMVDTTAKYAKDIKYAVYYYWDRFEKWHRILTFANIHIMDR